MSTTDDRIRRLAAAARALAEGQFDTPLAPQANGDALGDLERAMAGLQASVRKNNAESNIAISSLATANVRVMLWNEALQKVNHADNLLYHGGDIDTFFRQIVGDAMEMTRAHYGALGVFDKEGKVVRFVTLGIDDETVKAIGHAPVGKGLLEAVLHQETPTRVDDISAHPDSCGFPPGHPPMKSLIGMPLRIGGRVKGAFYLADKDGGGLFGEQQEATVDGFAEEDEIMLALFGDYLVRALERMDLMQQLQESNGLLETESAELQQLIEKLNAAQNQLLQSEKMASIGQLAAGVAHEINNPIGFINSNVGSLERYLSNVFTVLDAYEHAQASGSERNEACAAVEALKEQMDFAFLRQDIVELMAETKDGIVRVKKIVQDLKDFSHVDEAEWQWADLHKGLDSTLNVVNNEIKYKADVVKAYGELPEVECLPFQLNQVFMNLLVNAAHAIGERGIITLRTGRDGDDVWVEVADTGCGIAPESMKRIFDPFFTTKPVGKGTGLGLSLSYGIVQKHHGRIEVKSEIGKGATFRVVLPVKQSESTASGGTQQ